MKILEEKYPMGSFKGQKTSGRYIDGWLYDNMKILAEKIVEDNTFLGVCYSSTLEVGTGKSVMMTQLGEVWSHLMKEVHNIDVPFTCNNIVWRGKELIDRSLSLPKYSCILLDEWEDAHYWSELGMTLRTFFRKCRQLNLFVIVIIPNFFQFPMSYALGRSVFAIDVKFEGNFERGFYSFYNFDAKRQLYLLGKKTQNYKCWNPTFSGRFTNGYGVPEEEYRKAKLEDLKKWEEKDKEERKGQQRRENIVPYVDNFVKLMKKYGVNITQEDLVPLTTQLSEMSYYRDKKELEKKQNLNENSTIEWDVSSTTPRTTEILIKPKGSYNPPKEIEGEPLENNQ